MVSRQSWKKQRKKAAHRENGGVGGMEGRKEVRALADEEKRVGALGPVTERNRVLRRSYAPLPCAAPPALRHLLQSNPRPPPPFQSPLPPPTKQ